MAGKDDTSKTFPNSEKSPKTRGATCQKPCLTDARHLFGADRGRREVTVRLETDFLDTRCAELAAERGLSDREAEIVRLLCRGRSRAFVAETLYLSENTVKWYCRQIYQKLGIHSKQELLTLVGVEA